MKLLKCNECGKIILSMDGGYECIRCCGQAFSEVLPSNEEGYLKHKPICEVNDGEVYVRVGEDAHPMEEEHYIKFIVGISSEGVEVRNLKPGDAPEAVLRYVSDMEVYALCNKHSVWKAEKIQ